MKTIKYMALAALICCGHSAFGMNFTDKPATLKTVTDFSGAVDSLKNPLGKFITKGKITTFDEFKAHLAIYKNAQTSIDNYLTSLKSVPSSDKTAFNTALSAYNSLRWILEGNLQDLVNNMTYTDAPNRKAMLEFFMDNNNTWKTRIDAVVKKLGLKSTEKATSVTLEKTMYAVPKAVEYK